jgi:hypothetical protein
MATPVSLGALILLGGTVAATEGSQAVPALSYCQVRGERGEACLKCRAGYLKDSKGVCRQAGDFATDHPPRLRSRKLFNLPR